MINIVLNQKKNQNALEKKIVVVQGVGKKTKSKNIKGIALENKIGQQKSRCVDCGPKNSTFLKRVKNKKQFSQITKTCIFIVKNVETTQVTRFQKYLN